MARRLAIKDVCPEAADAEAGEHAPPQAGRQLVRSTRHCGGLCRLPHGPWLSNREVRVPCVFVASFCLRMSL